MLEGLPFRRTVELVASGSMQPKPKAFIDQMVREGGISRKFIAKALGVQPGQMRGVVGGMKVKELQNLCSLVLTAR